MTAARLERLPLLAGLVLVTAHLLDLALSGPDTAPLGIVVILALPAAWALAQPRVTRPARFALGVSVGLIAAGFAAVSHGLHVVNSGPDWRDLTGVGAILGGLLLAVSGVTALATPRRTPRRSGNGWRAAHAAGWIAGAVVVGSVAVFPFLFATLVTHAPRWAVRASALGIAHEEVRIAGFGLSLGGEVLLEAAARDHRIAAVVADGAARPADAETAAPRSPVERAQLWLDLEAVRAVSGMKPAPSLIPLMPRIAPRPVLLVAGGGRGDEIPASRLYRDAGGPSVALWELPDTAHTAGLRTHPAEYERRTAGFLDRSL